MLALLAFFIIIGIFVLPFDTYLQRYIHAGVILVLGFIASSIKLMGAGDAKFATAMAPFVALYDISQFLIVFAASVIVCFVIHRLARLSPIRSWTPGWESWERTREFPMGFPLGLSLVTYLVLASLR